MDSIANIDTIDEIRVNMDVPEPLWLRAKCLAVMSKKQLKQVVAEALEEYIQNHPAEGR